MDQNPNGIPTTEEWNAAQSTAPVAQSDSVVDEPVSEMNAEIDSNDAIYFSAQLEEADESPENVPEQPKKSVKLAVAVVAIVALLAVAAIFLASSLKPTTIVHENDLGYTSYTMTEEQATNRVMNQVVATCGNWELTNRELPYYYWEQYYSFVNQYSYYLSYILDASLELDEQLYDETTTWQQQFLTAAVQSYGMLAAVCQEAEANGFALSEEEEAQLVSIRENIENSAELYGYASTDDLIRESFGPHASLEDYLSFLHLTMTVSSYVNAQVEKIEYTDDDLSAYYDQYAEEYAAQGLLKVDKPVINIRHILIQPTETNEDGSFTDAAWEAAKEEADRIYAEWEASDHSEDTFAQMAQEYSVDGSASNGGLYENVFPGQMVTEFNDWCFADDRQTADYGMVKTQFGYHIMFFSGVGEEIYWRTAIASDYLNDQSSTLVQDICSRYPVVSTLDYAGLLPLPEIETSTPESESSTSESETTATE